MNEKRVLGKGTTAMEVGAIGYGCMGFVHGCSVDTEKEKAVKVVRQVAELGVDLFDTAESYGGTRSESIVGEALEVFDRDSLKICSKFGYEVTPGPDFDAVNAPLNSKPDHIRRVIEGTLKRLRTDHLDMYYQHRVDPDVPIEEVAGTIKELTEQGKVLHWGLSEANAETIRRAHAVLPLTAVQNEYSMWMRTPEKTIFPTLEELGIGLVAYGALGKGFLTGTISAEATFDEKDFRSFLPRFQKETMEANQALVDLIIKTSKEKGCSGAQLSLAWILAQRSWIVPIPGSRNINRIKENLGAVNVHFTQEELRNFDEALEQINIIGERYSGKFAQTVQK